MTNISSASSSPLSQSRTTMRTNISEMKQLSSFQLSVIGSETSGFDTSGDNLQSTYSKMAGVLDLADLNKYRKTFDLKGEPTGSDYSKIFERASIISGLDNASTDEQRFNSLNRNIALLHLAKNYEPI